MWPLVHQSGLSPRVRGNRIIFEASDGETRSIPARAGEPGTARRPTPQPPVYPRACGGTHRFRGTERALRGLSPRVRGNPGYRIRFDNPLGSIPARAGEPNATPSTSTTATVYPRACGGTGTSKNISSLDMGLSPRVRGNPVIRAHKLASVRSIPARAGEPAPLAFQAQVGSVYPRACGGTCQTGLDSCLYTGLSPRVRGNPTTAARADPGVGSIPARAGEPHHGSQSRPRSRVYPRACGGTCYNSWHISNRRGLSPRVRGNRLQTGHVSVSRGSIPARAGEPCVGRQSRERLTVYPRACGGTASLTTRRRYTSGLSPRVRGNRSGRCRRRI